MLNVRRWTFTLPPVFAPLMTTSHRIDFLGCPLDLFTSDELLAELTDKIQRHAPSSVIQFANANKIAKVGGDEEMKQFLDEADYVLADGQPLLPMGKMLGVSFYNYQGDGLELNPRQYCMTGSGFVCEMGSKAEDGDFATFRARFAPAAADSGGTRPGATGGTAHVGLAGGRRTSDQQYPSSCRPVRATERTPPRCR